MVFERINQLKRINKDYYSIADMEKVFNLRKKSLLVALSRLEKKERIKRISKGIYLLPDSAINFEKIASQIYAPAYVSFESALARYGILSQIPYDLTMATTNRPKKMFLGAKKIEFRQLKKELFFGFSFIDGVYVADPEKALLDQLYLVSKGKANLDIEELDLGKINKKELFSLAKKFPIATQKLVRGLTPLR